MTKIFEIFDNYSRLAPLQKFTMGSSRKFWIKIYVFSNDKADLVKELETLNFLLIEHILAEEGSSEFSVCIEHLPELRFVLKFYKNSKKKKKKKKKNAYI